MDNSTRNTDIPQDASAGLAASDTHLEDTGTLPGDATRDTDCPTVLAEVDAPPLVQARLDWLEATCSGVSFQAVLAALDYTRDVFVADVPTFEERNQTAGKYNAKASHMGIAIFHRRNNEAPGCRVRLSGEGCQTWEDDHPGLTLMDLVMRLHALAPKINRIDVALDDFGGLLDVNTLEVHRSKEWFGFKGQKRSFRCDKSGSGENETITLYCGSTKSDWCGRFYDKAKQCRVLGIEDERAAGHWTRAEVQARNQAGQEIFERIVSEGNIGAVGAGSLGDRLILREPSKDSNRSRWPVAPFWHTFLTAAQAAKVARCRPTNVSSLLARFEWFRAQANVTLAMVYLNGDMPAVMREIEDGIKKMKPQHWAMLPVEKRQQTVDMPIEVNAPEDMSEEEKDEIMQEIHQEEARAAWLEEERRAAEEAAAREREQGGWDSCMEPLARPIDPDRARRLLEAFGRKRNVDAPAV